MKNWNMDEHRSPMTGQMIDEMLEQMEKECEILGTISENYPKDSPEATALRRSAFALIFAAHKHHREFIAFLEKMRSPLSIEQVQKMKELAASDEELREILGSDEELEKLTKPK
jgi:hypothetical protein